MTKEVLKMALECAERCEAIDGMYSWSATITAIKEALAQEQEPVATIAVREHAPVGKVAYVLEVNLPVGIHKLYTIPPQRTWVGLTDEEISELRLKTFDAVATNHEVYRAIEAKLKEFNT
jgi:hypothetical protein